MEKQEVGIKILRGVRLSLPEFRLALESSYLSGVKPESDRELAEAYLMFLGQCYEDDKRQAYLCGKHPARVIKTEMKDGREVKTCCAFGIHLDEVKPKALTKENLKHLRHCFGKNKVKELTGR